MKSRIRQLLVARAPRGRPHRVLPLALALVAVLGACSEGTGPLDVVRITPANQTVTLHQTPTGAALRTSVTLTNTSSRPVVYDPCALTLEKKAEGYMLVSAESSTPWIAVWAPICVLFDTMGIARLTVLPHSSVSIPIDAATASTAFPAFDGSPGTYRVHLVLQTEIIGVPRDIPHDSSVSDPFMIVVQ
jgi:hypothetical protein